MRYVTRPGLHIDRCASAWLIKRFIDPNATFLFAEHEVEGAIPFDMPGVPWSHHRGRCSFEVILEAKGLRDAALVELGRIVRSADILASADETLEGTGLDLLFRGLRLTQPDDERILEHAFPIFEALYAALRERFAAPRNRGQERGKRFTSRRKSA